MCFTLAAAPPGSWEEPHGSLQLRSKLRGQSHHEAVLPVSYGELIIHGVLVFVIKLFHEPR